MSVRKFRVLLADDSEDDRFLIGRAFRRSPDFELVHELDTGDQVIAYLAGAGCYADRSMYPVPDLLLLDLKMPRADGFDVLEWMRASKVSSPRVVVFSSSPLPRDVRRALELGADSYQLKPRHIEDLPVVIEKLRFLLSTRELGPLCPSCGAYRCDLDKHAIHETVRG